MGELTKEVCFPSSKWLVSLFAIPLNRSVPAPLDLRPEHLIIDVSAAIPQNLIEFVPVALASRVRQIDAPVDDFFAVAARGARYEPAGTADDDALAFETLVAFRANSVGAGNEKWSSYGPQPGAGSWPLRAAQVLGRGSAPSWWGRRRCPRPGALATEKSRETNHRNR